MKREREEKKNRPFGQGSTIFISHSKLCFQQVFRKKKRNRKKKEIELELAKEI